MRAVRIHGYGGPEELRFEDLPDPVAGEGEVVVRLAGAGLNPLDWKVRRGYMAEHLPLPMPFTLGWDISGDVESLGPGVNGLSIGTPVLGFLPLAVGGGYAEKALVPSPLLVRRPEGLDPVEAASLPLAAATAWQALRKAADVTPSDRVLILGGAGGVGSLAVQLAKHLGAEVVATAGPSDGDLLRRLGANDVVDVRTQGLDAFSNSFDVVLDTVGPATRQAAIKTLRASGRFVTIVPPAPDEAIDVEIIPVFAAPHLEGLRPVVELVASGKMQPHVREVLPWPEVRSAHAAMEAGRMSGNRVLAIR